MPNPKIISLIDLTYLPDAFDQKKDEAEIIKLCDAASNEFGTVAALCVHPQYVAFAKQELVKRNITIPVATVVNFPTGEESLEAVSESIRFSLEAGADEIDIVMPYKKLQEGRMDEVRDFLQACKNLLPENVLFKVIIESGVLTQDEVRTATEIVCDIEADFVKTSTGKVKDKGASMDAVKTMLEVLFERIQTGGLVCGLKISGGVSIKNADEFFNLVKETMGKVFMTSATFRFGASALLGQLVVALKEAATAVKALVGSKDTLLAAPQQPGPTSEATELTPTY